MHEAQKPTENVETTRLDKATNSERAMGGEAAKGEGTAKGNTLKEKWVHFTRADRRAVGWTRFIAFVPFLGLFISAIVLTVMALISTVKTSWSAITGEVDLNHLLVEYIEFADIFLLAIVLYILALGVFSLFIDDRIPLPQWLQIHDLDDLKEKLVSVVGVVLGVFFMGRLINGQETIDTLFMGVGIAAVIVALAYFVKSVMKP